MPLRRQEARWWSPIPAWRMSTARSLPSVPRLRLSRQVELFDETKPAGQVPVSDGFPQDFDYGQDRRSNVYGLRDTTVALREVEAAGITPFCITVDKAGHDYLREMCDGSRYMVIEDIAALPRELPKIYQRLVWSG